MLTLVFYAPAGLHFSNEKSAQRRRKHCALAVIRGSQKKIRPPHTPFLGAPDGQNLISWRWSLPSPTDPVWWRSIYAISSYRGAHKQTNTQTDRGDYNTLRRSLARSVNITLSAAPMTTEGSLLLNSSVLSCFFSQNRNFWEKLTVAFYVLLSCMK